jgi:hypothetical protein
MASKVQKTSIGPPEKSKRRRTPSREIRDEGRLPHHLRQRRPPPPPTKGEQKILDLLWAEYRKADAAARAAARFEVDVHEDLRQKRIEEGFLDEEAGNIQRVFYKEEFNDTFRKLMQLRIENRLISLLGLGNFREDILRQRIATVFHSSTKTITVDGDSLHVGTPEEQQLLELKHKRRR